MHIKYVVRWIFLVSNSAFWLLSLILVGFLLWLAVSDYEVLFYASLESAFLYVLSISALSTFVIGFLGCCISVNLNSKLIKTYLVLCALCLLYELGVSIALAIYSNKTTALSFEDWRDAGPEFRDYIQHEYDCCGYYGFEDHTYVEKHTRSSCYNVTVVGNTTWYVSHKDPCRWYLTGIVDEYLVIPLFIVIVILIFLVIALGTGADLLTRLRKVVVVAKGNKKKKFKYRFINSPFAMALEKHKQMKQEEELANSALP